MSEPAIVHMRTATPADAPAIARLLQALGYPVTAGAIPARLTSIAAEGGAVLLAVDDADLPCGLVALARHTSLHGAGPVGYITSLVTAPDARGRGIGRALVAAAERWARGVGCSRLSVTSAEHRADAHAFYPACGMPYTGRRFAKTLE